MSKQGNQEKEILERLERIEVHLGLAEFEEDLVVSLVDKIIRLDNDQDFLSEESKLFIQGVKKYSTKYPITANQKYYVLKMAKKFKIQF